MNVLYEEAHAPPPVSRLWWSVPAVLFVGLVMIASFVGGAPQRPTTATSFDTSGAGYRGLYLLLDELHYPVERSRRVIGGGVRWLLAPKKSQEHDAAALREWVRNGGRLLLAPASSDVADQLGLAIHVGDDSAGSVSTSIAEVPRLAVGPQHVESRGDIGQVWESADEQPLVSIHSEGNGEIWLLHRPGALANEQLRVGDNAVFACRLAEAMLTDHAGPIAFDEFFHGLRERPGVVELLWQPPVRYVTLQALVLGLFILWRSAVRFGPLAPLPAVRRRSKEEFLDAYADLLHRQRDAAAAFRTVQQDLTQRLVAEMGLPEGTHPEDVAREASRRRGADPERIIRLLTAPVPWGGKGNAALLHSLSELEAATRELLRNR